MKASELKYVTEFDINAAYVNVTSADMYKEVQKLNGDMLKMQKKRIRFLKDFWAMAVSNIFMLILGMLAAVNGGSISLLCKPERIGNVWICIGFSLIFLVLFGWFVIFRRIYSWKLGLLITAPLILVNYAFILLTICNVYLLMIMNAIDKDIRDQAGYPHFTQLVTSYIRDEENAEEGEMDDAEYKYKSAPEPEEKGPDTL